MDKENVVSGVRECTRWWIRERRKKLEGQLSETMSVNPFLMPFLFDFHDLGSFDDLAELMVASHLITGHNTGFGKLIDEKVLPQVFGTTAVNPAFRKRNHPFGLSCFDEIDHIVKRADGKKELLSLKAGRWTIQLTMAVQLNAAFNEILRKHGNVCDRIVVGVFYGKSETLTDKYDILRGINRGAKHDVVDLTDKVFVFTGRGFWSWLNGGKPETQEWVLEGILKALGEEEVRVEAKKLLSIFKKAVIEKYDRLVVTESGVDWRKLLELING